MIQETQYIKKRKDRCNFGKDVKRLKHTAILFTVQESQFFYKNSYSIDKAADGRKI